jgi:hypothetical protein
MNPPAVATELWNSLEVTKLLVGAMGPLMVALVGFGLSRRLKRLELSQWANQKVVEKRIRVYEEVVPKLNQVYCFFTERGTWKALTPPGLIDLKRELDQAVHVNAPLFSPGVLRLYFAFMDGCFRTHKGVGVDAEILKSHEYHKLAAGTGWNSAWEKGFSGKREVDAETLSERYRAVVGAMAAELGVNLALDGLSAAIDEAHLNRRLGIARQRQEKAGRQPAPLPPASAGGAL